ncbi:PH domain-containing protein [Winogradskyella ursingii]|uniref:PH domain-containing protein n=1 Tax=Winogradskyella ursingii TaxID=2686079 RepID=UPI0015C854D7|nr:PH domain-containing protein [Winogradskyella ursingii]
MDFSNAPIEIENLPKLDDTELKLISRKYLNVIVINTLIVYVVLFSLLISAKLISDDVAIQQYFWYPFFSILGIMLLNIVLVVLAFHKRKYAVRDHDVIYSKGLLVNSVTTVPISRIQHIEASRSWLARQFGLATLNLFTAGESGSDLSIKGLPEVEAKQINDFISGKVNGN